MVSREGIEPAHGESIDLVYEEHPFESPQVV
jgi:hypothetical protein